MIQIQNTTDLKLPALGNDDAEAAMIAKAHKTIKVFILMMTVLTTLLLIKE
jgi:hypothetical protein